MNEFFHYSRSLTTSLLVLCVTSYTKRYIRWSNRLTLHTKYSSPCPMYSTWAHLYPLNLPFTTLNIFLLYSDILLLVLKQFIMHKESPYSTQIPVWHKCYIIFLLKRAHYINQYTHYSKVQWHSTHPLFILCNHHRFFAQKNQCSMCTGFISRWVTVGNLQLLCSQPKLASSNIAHTVEKWDKNLLITKLIRYNLVCICHVAWFAN